MPVLFSDSPVKAATPPTAMTVEPSVAVATAAVVGPAPVGANEIDGGEV